jgi:hypothetical protein
MHVRRLGAAANIARAIRTMLCKLLLQPNQKRKSGMSMLNTIGGLVAGAAVLAACQPQTQRSPVNYGGMQEQQLRTLQREGAMSGTNPGVQNPVATGANPGTTGIERAPTGGTGSVGAGAPTSVDPGTTGITRQRGVGAPVR